jgi:hypothetical protein
MTEIHITGRSLYLYTVTEDSREQCHVARGIRTAVSDYKQSTATEETGRAIDRTVFCRTTFVPGQNSASPTDIKSNYRTIYSLAKGWKGSRETVIKAVKREETPSVCDSGFSSGLRPYIFKLLPSCGTVLNLNSAQSTDRGLPTLMTATHHMQSGQRQNIK